MSQGVLEFKRSSVGSSNFVLFISIFYRLRAISFQLELKGTIWEEGGWSYQRKGILDTCKNLLRPPASF